MSSTRLQVAQCIGETLPSVAHQLRLLLIISLFLLSSVTSKWH